MRRGAIACTKIACSMFYIELTIITTLTLILLICVLIITPCYFLVLSVGWVGLMLHIVINMLNTIVCSRFGLAERCVLQ